MFKRILISLSVVLLLTAVFSCDDSDDTGTGPYYVSPKLGNFAVLDTSQYFLIKSKYSEGQSLPEIYLWWEEIIGEPYIDVNENGEYDPGVDIFIMSVGDDNMDLDHDGAWTGPDDPWHPGTPFDDIDGNGSLRQEYFFQNGVGGDNVPFLDANGNGIFDSAIGYVFGIARPNLALETDSTSQWRFLSPVTALYYLSDSGIEYFPIIHHARCPICYSAYSWIGALELDDDGKRLCYFYNTLTFELLPTETIVEDTGRVELVGSEAASFFRQISLDQTLDIDGKRHYGLIKVRCDQFQFTDYPNQIRYEGAYLEFYFKSQYGLLCVRGIPEAGVNEQWHYFEAIDGSPPFILEK